MAAFISLSLLVCTCIFIYSYILLIHLLCYYPTFYFPKIVWGKIANILILLKFTLKIFPNLFIIFSYFSVLFSLLVHNFFFFFFFFFGTAYFFYAMYTYIIYNYMHSLSTKKNVFIYKIHIQWIKMLNIYLCQNS
ncbi:hypothetical protein PVPCR_1100590 [Plasmodium vinckei petteri]|uniref:Uncharacterized protein n=1 Tax=Plasmodium vinckei petteri TaxID=138298 RepID=A0A6V7T4C5_PLAVN|nr:hypothetical protein PVPCR_1100590 [Plasmodium vinckei petteri]